MTTPSASTITGCLCGCDDKDHSDLAPRCCKNSGGPEGGCGCSGYTPGTYCADCGGVLDDGFGGHEAPCYTAMKAELDAARSEVARLISVAEVERETRTVPAERERDAAREEADRLREERDEARQAAFERAAARDGLLDIEARLRERLAAVRADLDAARSAADLLRQERDDARRKWGEIVTADWMGREALHAALRPLVACMEKRLPSDPGIDDDDTYEIAITGAQVKAARAAYFLGEKP